MATPARIPSTAVGARRRIGPREWRLDEVVDVVRYLISLGDNVELGPQIALRTMRNPMAS